MMQKKNILKFLHVSSWVLSNYCQLLKQTSQVVRLLVYKLKSMSPKERFLNYLR